MKICFISSYPPEKEGVGQSCKRLVDNLKDKKINISVLTYNYKFDYKDNRIHQVLGISPKNILKTYRTLKSISPDIIHVQYATPVFRLLSPILLALLWIYKKYNKTKIIFTYHEVSSETDLLKFFGIVYYSLISSIADRIIVHTKQSKQILVNKCKVPSRKIKVIRLGLFLSIINPEDTKNSYNIKDVDLTNKKIILFFGYIHIAKGIENLIKAVNLLYIDYPELRKNTVTLIAGDVRPRKGIFKLFELVDYNYKRNLFKLTEQLSLKDNVYFSGYIKNEDVIPLMKSSTMLVMPYHKVEQSGVVNLALNLKLPIIASNIGGLKELLEKTGLTFEPENLEKLKQKIYSVLISKSNINYDKIYDEIIVNNSLKKVIDKHTELYLNIMK